MINLFPVKMSLNNSRRMRGNIASMEQQQQQQRSFFFGAIFLLHLIFQPIGCDVTSSQLFPSPSSSSAAGAGSGGLVSAAVPGAPAAAGEMSMSTSMLQQQCSNCRGDNSTCRVVSGIFSRPQLNVGYNLVAHIPRGACNLTITEMRKSPNHLALQRRDGSFILNGDWRLSQSGEYPGAGTVFQYKRQDLKSSEGVSTPGPLLEPVDLMVLYQQPNPVIKYEYLMPGMGSQGDISGHHHSLAPLPLLSPPPPDHRHGHHQQQSQQQQHHHRHSAPVGSSISAATSRPASYVRFPPPPGSSSLLLHQPQQHPASATNAIAPFPPPIIHPEVSGGSGAPGGGNSLYGGDPWNSGGVAGRRREGPSPGVQGSSEKKFSWKVVAFTNCSEPCGGGLQRSVIRCVRHPAGNPVSDRRCSQEGAKPPSQTTRCNVKPCPAEWVIGDWGGCQGECGEGFRTRPVHCQQRVSPTLKMVVAEGACLSQRPESRISCTLPRQCNHWTASEWSQCSAQCGSGVRKRSVGCVGSTGQRLQEAECDSTEKPPELTPCNMGPCEGVDWFASEWSGECSQKCGSGLQTRHVVCSSLNHPQQGQRGRGKLSYYYSYGGGAASPPYQNVSQYSKKRARVTSSELETNLIDEEAVGGGGDGSDDNAIHDEAFIQEEADEGLEMDGGLQTQCDESRRPSEERECFSERSCGEHVWFSGPWGECSVTCGTGLRTRQVLCVIFSRGKFKVASDSSFCPNDASGSKPSEREPCSGLRCPQRWFTTEWSECSALCGGGLQKRSVSCRSSNWTLPSSLCYDKDRPVERRSCNENRCTSPATPPTPGHIAPTSSYLSPSSHENSTGMFRDTSGGVLLSPSSSLVSPSQSSSLSHDHRRISSSYRPRGPPTASSPEQLSPDEDDRPANCTDEYRNCALVVQARLCRYKYYRSVCCSSCLDASAY